jgi:hypothetical protein
MDDEILDQEIKEELHPEGDHSGGFKDFLKQNKIVVITSAITLVVIIGVAIFVFTGNGQKDIVSTNVVLQVKGPKQITSGNEAEYSIIYRNGENADMVDITLEVFYPDDFEFKSADPESISTTGQRFDLPNLDSGDDGIVNIRGKLSGGTGAIKEIRAKMEYRLSNFNSIFNVTATANTTILAPNLVLEIDGPIDVTNGQDTTFTLNYRNVSTEDFENLAIVLNPPSGFNFTSSSPPANDNNQWLIPTLAPKEQGTIEVTGSFTGDANRVKLMIANLGLQVGENFAPLITSSATFRIVTSALWLAQSASPGDVAYLGDQIKLDLDYGNNGNVGMTNVVITLDLEGAVVDLTKLRVNNAIITGNRVTWKSATLSNLGILAPSQEGELTLTIPLKKEFTSNLKNQIIRAVATIASDQVPKQIRADDIEIKLGSTLGLSVNGSYVSGSLPMKVGETTVFALTFLATNQSNDLESTELIASMPLPSSAWTNVIQPAGEQDRISFDVNAGKIKWNLGDLAAFSGKFTPAPSVTFELAVTPNETDLNQTITLLRDIQVAGRDGFTGEDVESELIRTVTTSSLDDPRIRQFGGSVK